MTASFTWSFTTAGVPSIQNGLVAEWNFNEGSGTTTADDTGNGHTGTLVGSVTWTTGLVGRAYALASAPPAPATSRSPILPSLEFSATQSFSLTAWVYVPSLSDAGWASSISRSACGNYYGIWINSTING